MKYLLFVGFLLSFSYASISSAATLLEIEKITIGEEMINIKTTQLIEIAVKNKSNKDIPVVVKLVITLPNHNIITFGEKKINAKAQTISYALIPYWIDQKRSGDYTIGSKVFSPKGKLLASSNKDQVQFFFANDPTRKRQLPRTRGKDIKKKQMLQMDENQVQKAPIIQFEPADLLWNEVRFINKISILRGESANIRLVLQNNGGDIASNVKYSLYWYFVHRPKRKLRFFHDQIRVIAPGEKKVMEIPITIPHEEQKGKYQILAVVDEGNEIKEANTENNQSKAATDMIFSDIALINPVDGHSFAEDGLYFFEWRSNKYNQFKVEISADPSFLVEDSTFRIPKGEGDEGWTSSTSIKPLQGEMMPGLATGILESNNTDHLYWRVIARNSKGEITASENRKFYINLNAN